MNLNTAGGESNTIALIQNNIAKIEPLNMPIKVDNISTTFLVVSGSACSILNRSLASQLVKSKPRAFWFHENVSPQLRTFLNEPICNEGKVQAPTISNGWTSSSATFAVVADGLKSLISRDLFDLFGLAVTQPSSSPGNQVNAISSSSELKEHIAQSFPILTRASEDQKITLLNQIFAKVPT